jgi:hypothetical protein
MARPLVLHQEWRAEQYGSKYPFSDAATLRADSGMELGIAAIADAALFSPGAENGLRLTRIDVGTGAVGIVVGDAADAERGQATFDPAAPPAAVPVLDAAGRTRGVLVPGDPEAVAVLQAWPRGSHSFAAGAADFVPAVCLPMPEAAVRTVRGGDGSRLSGQVWLVGERGVVLRGDADRDTVRVDIVGDPLFRRRLCEDEGEFRTPRLLRTINGLPPNADGNFPIFVADSDAARPALRVVPTAEGIRIEIAGGTLYR